MNFSEALHDLKNGFQLTRPSWESALYVVLQHGYPQGVPINSNTAGVTGLPEGTVCVFHPYLMMSHLDRSFSPWVPSIGDLLAEDWTIYTNGQRDDAAAHTFGEPIVKLSGDALQVQRVD